MKVALLLSGQIRNALETFPFFEKNILSLYDTDVFISSWINTENINSSDNFKKVPNDDSIVEIIKLYNPTSIEFESYDKGYNDKWIEMTNPFQNKKETNTNLVSICSMFYKTMRVSRLKNEFKKINSVNYDFVIQTRPDIKIMEKVNLEKGNNNDIFIPMGWDWSGGLNNLMAWGNENVMDKYCNIFLNYSELLESIPLINSEKITKEYVKNKLKLNVKRPILELELRNVSIKTTYWFQTT